MINLTQAECDTLLAMEKRRVNDQTYNFTSIVSSLTIPWESKDQRERFILDISRGRINLLKGKYQTRAHQVIVLARIDFAGSPHRNPDGEEIVCPHLHVYRDGYGDKWATPLPPDRFSNANDPWHLLMDFLSFCNVTEDRCSSAD